MKLGFGTRRWLAALACMWLPTAAMGQVEVGAFGGAVVPLAGFADVAELGFAASAFASMPLGGGPFAVETKATYGSAPHAVDGDRSRLVGVSALASYPLLAAGETELRAAWGGGVLWHGRRSDTFPGLDATRMGGAVDVGIRVSRPVADVHVVLGASYTRGLGDIGSSNFPTEMLTVGAGLSMSLGGR